MTELFIVPTPIGNLDDMSPRAVSVLKNVDLIACEDTRHSSRLLQHFGIDTRTISLHKHNETNRSQYLLEKMQKGEKLALISDAGTPLINDPGFELVRLCRQQNLTVVALPGACALTTALSGSGMPTDNFHFGGFFPLKEKARGELIHNVLSTGITYIYYESPKRIVSALEFIQQNANDIHVMIAKELTKAHENYRGNTAKEILAWLKDDESRQKGEFVLMMRASDVSNPSDIPAEAIALLDALKKELPPKKASLIVAQHYNVNKKALYQMIIEGSI